MGKIIITCFSLLFLVPQASASKLNLDPYFAIGASALRAEIAGQQATEPSFVFIAGSALNWISPNLAAEIRFGFGGQYTTFNGDISSYTSFLLKPRLNITRSLDIYGLAGVTTVSVNLASQQNTATGTSYGAGVAYRIPNESLSITGEWVNYHSSSDQSSTSLSGMDITGVSINLVFEYY